MTASLLHVYQVRGDEDARRNLKNFLKENDEIEDTLFAAQKKLAKYFPDAPLYLEYDEEDIDVPFVIVSVDAHLPPKDAVRMLRAFDYDWWLNQPMSLHGMIIFTLE